MTKDPVCGMEIEEAAARSLYQGEIYYFCSTSCQEVFDADPQRYVSAPSTGVLADARND